MSKHAQLFCTCMFMQHCIIGTSSHFFLQVLGNQSTAVPGLDVVPASGIVAFGPGESNRTIDLQIVSDQVCSSN